MNPVLKCILLDDELPGLRYLRLLCEQISNVVVVKAFNDPIKFIKESKTLEFDVCILDIEMPAMNGLELAKLIGGKPVIFTTGYSEYAAEAFDLEAIDYIRKPIQKDRLEKALQKASQFVFESRSRLAFMQVNTDKGKALLYFNRIRYITTSEYDSRDKRVLLDDSSEIIVKNLGFNKILSMLPPLEFCQISKKDVIALRVVRFYSHDKIQTNINADNIKGIELSLSENYRENFLRKLRESS